jgi:hypothetical protein
MQKRSVFAALAAVAVTATAAYAIVTFDTATGTGFVGKGDVQLAFDWNNKALQQNAAQVTFTYDDNVTYDILCEQQQTANQKTFQRSQGINAVMDGDPRQVKGQKQFTGFILSGFDGDPVESGEAVCPGGFNEISREPVASTGGGLYAHYSGTSVLIWSPSAQ